MYVLVDVGPYELIMCQLSKTTVMKFRSYG